MQNSTGCERAAVETWVSWLDSRWWRLDGFGCWSRGTNKMSGTSNNQWHPRNESRQQRPEPVDAASMTTGSLPLEKRT